MANYADDLDDRGVASGLPTGFTVRWATGATWSTIDTGGGNIALRRVHTSNVRSFASLDAIDSDADRDDVEVLVRFSGSAFGTSTSGVVLRGSGSAGAETGYVAMTTTAGDVRFTRYVSGTLTAIATDTSANLDASTYYWMRARVSGTSYAITYWSGAEGDDPGTPQLSGTDSNISGVGWAGVFAFNGSSANYDWSDIAIATNGDVATMAVGGTFSAVGALTSQAATLAGTANHVTVHASSGALTAQAAAVSGSASLAAGGTFSAVGALTSQAATVSGAAAHYTLHTAAADLVAQTATLSGTAAHYTLHTATGSLIADSASASGAARNETTYVAPVPRTGAGRPSRQRQRQRVVVEIDGEDFIAESVEEARALLDKAKDAAEEKASIAVKRATEAKKRPARKIVADARKSLALPTINAPGLEDYAGQIAQQIEDLYRSTIKTIEVESLLRNRDRAEEDDEDILLLIA